MRLSLWYFFFRSWAKRQLSLSFFNRWRLVMTICRLSYPDCLSFRVSSTTQQKNVWDEGVYFWSSVSLYVCLHLFTCIHVLTCPGKHSYTPVKLANYLSGCFDCWFQMSNAGPSGSPLTDIAFSFPLRTTDNKYIYYIAGVDVSRTSYVGLCIIQWLYTSKLDTDISVRHSEFRGLFASRQT